MKLPLLNTILKHGSDFLNDCEVEFAGEKIGAVIRLGFNDEGAVSSILIKSCIDQSCVSIPVDWVRNVDMETRKINLTIYMREQQESPDRIKVS